MIDPFMGVMCWALVGREADRLPARLECLSRLETCVSENVEANGILSAIGYTGQVRLTCEEWLSGETRKGR